jgi:hypothetical protein
VIVVGELSHGAIYASRGRITVEIEHGAECSECGARMPKGTAAFFEWDNSNRQRSKTTASGYSVGATTIRHRIDCQQKPDMPSANPPFVVGSQTSMDAAAAIAPATPNLRARVLHMLRVQGPATDEEGSERLSMDLNSYRPRRIELVESGVVVDSGHTRKTHAGRQATVWTTT